MLIFGSELEKSAEGNLYDLLQSFQEGAEDFFLFLKLLFNYSCLHFLPITTPLPIQTHLPLSPPPSPLVLSMCPL